MVSLTKRLALMGFAAASVLGVAAPTVNAVVSAAPASAVPNSCYWYETGHGIYRSGPNTGSTWISLRTNTGRYATVSVSTSQYYAYYYGKYWSGC